MRYFLGSVAALALTFSAERAVADPELGGPGKLLMDPAALMAPINDSDIKRAGSIYVPAYASLPVSGGRVDVSLSVTLSIRNASASRALAIRRIDQFDGNGARVVRYLDAPIAIRPLASVSLFLPVQAMAAGAAQMFHVDWGAADAMQTPIVEAVMVGQIGGVNISFASRGVPIEEATSAGSR